MAKIGPQRSGIDALIGERVGAGVPEHLGMLDGSANRETVKSAYPGRGRTW
jgi:hypothetical protein